MSLEDYDPLGNFFDDSNLNTTIMPDHLGYTVKNSNFRIGMFILGFVMLIVILVLIVLLFMYVNQSVTVTINPALDRRAPNLKKIKPGIVKDRIDVNSNPGSVKDTVVNAFHHGYRRIDDGNKLTTQVDCEATGGSWSGKSCQCSRFKWGPYCERDSYPNSYMMVEDIAPENLSVKDTYRTDSLGFGEGVRCTELCDQDNECVGVHWDKQTKTCKILDSVPDIKDLTFYLESDGNTFLKKDRGLGRPIAKHNVILYDGNLKQRFWLETNKLDDIQNVLIMDFNRVYKLDFYPTGYINDSRKIIVYSDRHFTLKEAVTAANLAEHGHDTPDFYVHVPGRNHISPPMSMTHDHYYGMVLSNDDIKSSILHNNHVDRTIKLISGSRSITKLSPSEYDSMLYSDSEQSSTISFGKEETGIMSSNWSY